MVAASSALLFAVVGTPTAIALGAFFAWRLSEGRPRILRLLLAWVCGAVLAYFFAVAWFVQPILATGDSEPTTNVSPLSGGPAELAGVVAHLGVLFVFLSIFKLPIAIRALERRAERRAHQHA